MNKRLKPAAWLSATAFIVLAPATVLALDVTYQPYLQPGDASNFTKHDSKVIAWQTDESNPNASAYVVEYGVTPKLGHKATVSGRIVDNYLSADPSLPVPPTAAGAHVNYYAVLPELQYNQTYYYRVTGPGLAAAGFKADFHTRKQQNHFSFQVVGDEGFFPTQPNSQPRRVINWEGRIVHEMYEVDKLQIPGVPSLPKPDLALNTGDNVYNTGSESNYREAWMPVWNNDISSNETGAPYIRHIPYYIVAGNHDLGGTGVTANLLSSGDGLSYSGSNGGGDSLQYFNNYYFPLNGPTGFDVQYTYNGDVSVLNGFYFSYNGHTYDSPAAIEAFRASTTVNTGKGVKRQIDMMGNYSFDQGNTHFVFLDGNPHLFSGLLDYSAVYQSPQATFSDYPSLLRNWLINDLDSSNQTWKVVVYHHPAFSSSNSTVRNFQMRKIAKLLEDHGVNLVFNGHAHNYQRTYPLRAQATVAEVPNSAGSPAVTIDNSFNGNNHAVPDGVIYLVEGAGGRDSHDSGGTNPRGSSATVDEDESATGTHTFGPGLTFPNGPAAWLDDHLTNPEMAPFIPNAGTSSKITAHFKGKIFSFADVVVDENNLTLYQISEPLQAVSSATAANPAPFGTDINNVPLNDPIPDTLIDPATGEVVSQPSLGTPALLDAFTITKPELSEKLKLKLAAPEKVKAGDAYTYTLTIDNHSAYALNGAQAVLTLPKGVVFAGNVGNDTVALSEQGAKKVVVTLGRLESGKQQTVQFAATLPVTQQQCDELVASAALRSGTALPVTANHVVTKLKTEGKPQHNATEIADKGDVE